MSERTESGRQEALMRVDALTIRFGGITALSEISFELPSGCVCGVMGPNGSGKTTLFNCLSRIYEPTSGKITFNGRDLTAYSPHHMVELGIGRTFQNVALCNGLTVRQNVALGSHCRDPSGFLATLLRLPRVAESESRTSAKVEELLRMLELDTVANAVSGTLPFGTRKKVELARALASNPKLLLLDEPAAGLNHQEVESLRKMIRHICDDMGITVLLVEHHMNLLMRVSDTLIALEYGIKIADGPPDVVSKDPAVMRAYLGAA